MLSFNVDVNNWRLWMLNLYDEPNWRLVVAVLGRVDREGCRLEGVRCRRVGALASQTVELVVEQSIFRQLLGQI
jgi:hypothetical protein